MAKQLSDLAKDLRAGLELGLEKATHDLVMEMKDIGPYWTGEFEAAWEVVPGQQLRQSTKAGMSVRDVDFDGPAARQVTAVSVPLTTLEAGYTIYNDMEYADKAMDLEPGPDGVYRGERPRETSKTGRDWFERFILGGEAYDVLGNGVEAGLRIAGFR
ncbi:MAG: hypothetical protein ACO23G_10855 [Limnohabitans sp.]